MVKDAYSITARELAELGPDAVPEEIVSIKNLIYSSPSTLSYNSPGARGFGVKRAGVAIPESVMLVVAPACCGRNTTVLADEGGYSDKMFFLQMDETDLITGRHLDDIPKAVDEVRKACDPEPKVVVICITCVDALLGTDLIRVCQKAEKYSGVKVVPSYMYALTREGKNPPMVAIRESIYSLLEKKPVQSDMVNLLGNFAPLEEDTELYDFLRALGIKKINEISKMKTFDEYLEMGAAHFNLILNPEARKAAIMLEKKLGMPFAELTRVYEIDRIRKQYALFASALGASFDDEKYYAEAESAVERFRQKFGGKVFAVGRAVNANSVELALALVKMGAEVSSVFVNISAGDFPYLRELAKLSPETKIYSTVSPTMLNYDGDDSVDISIGIDAKFYYPKSINIEWNDEVQPFGYKGLVHFIEAVERGTEK